VVNRTVQKPRPSDHATRAVSACRDACEDVSWPAADLGSVSLKLFKLFEANFYMDQPIATVQAICVTPFVNQRRVTASSSNVFSDRQSVSVTCPSGSSPYGVSGGMTGATGRAHLLSLALTGSTATIRSEWLSPERPSWYAYVHLVCGRG
jgi:hypothetical protein